MSLVYASITNCLQKAVDEEEQGNFSLAAELFREALLLEKTLEETRQLNEAV